MTTETASLGDFLKDLRRARGAMLVCAALAALAAALFIFVTVPQYKAQMLVSPSNPMNSAELSSLMQDDNLVALRMFAQRMGIGSSSDFMRFENMVAGPSVAAELLKDERVRTGLAQDRDFRFAQADIGWTPARLSEYMMRRVRLETVGTTPLRRLAYFHPDPVFAIYFLKEIHKITDALIRSSIRVEAAERAQYLQNAIMTTNNPDHRRALTTLLLEQERLRMLVSIDQPYTATVIEPAVSSYKPLWPDRRMVFAAFIAAGAIIGFAFSGVRPAKPSAAILAQKTRPMQARAKWFSDDNVNTNETARKLTSRAAAE